MGEKEGKWETEEVGFSGKLKYIVPLLTIAIVGVSVFLLTRWQPEPTVSVSSTGGAVQQGSSDTATVSITSVGGYAENVTLSASGQPSGVTVGFDPISGTPPFDSTLMIVVNAGAPVGTYDLTIGVTGTDGKKSTYTYSLTVTAPPPDFTISVSPTSGSIQQGSSDTATVSITSVGGYAETVTLSYSGQPVGVTIDFDPPSGTPTFTLTMTVSVGAGVSDGTYPITITGTGADAKVHSCTYTLTVGTPLTLPLFNDDGWGEGLLDCTWGNGSVNWEYTGEDPPEGTKCCRMTCTSQYYGGGLLYRDVGWNIHPEDLSAYTGGQLKICMKSDATVKVEIEGPEGTKSATYIPSTGGEWENISIDLSDFTGVHLETIVYPFMTTIETTGTFYFDDVRWVVII